MIRGHFIVRQWLFIERGALESLGGTCALIATHHVANLIELRAWCDYLICTRTAAARKET